MDRRQEGRDQRRNEKREKKSTGEKLVTAERSAHPSAERGTVDSSKRIEQVLQNPRGPFQETAAAVESARAPTGPAPLLDGAGGF